MTRIRLLPEQVANQIAAGEVVERPANVVKELVENSLDAGARQITVEIQAGGRGLIRVTDDGFGMSRDDALLSLERHATSKIRAAEDLCSISTMGFRGEALPSIASVSRMTITTREREGENPEGTQIIINGGKIVEVKAAGCAPGASIEVRQIFFNLPARRKFLRSEETEKAHIQHYLTLAALAHPGVAFTFLQDERLVWKLPAAKISQREEAEEGRGEKEEELMSARLQALQQRYRDLHGDESKLLMVNFKDALPPPETMEGEEPADPIFRVWGLIGAPGVSRSTREDQHLFVNKRPIENRSLNYALIEGYHTSLMKGRYPVCCLFLEIHPSLVDVNIHPAKREVKFHHDYAVRRLVVQAIRSRLLDFHLVPGARRENEMAPEPVTGVPVGADSGAKSEEHVLQAPAAPVPENQPVAQAAPAFALEAESARPEPAQGFLHPLPLRPITNWPQRPLPAAARPIAQAEPSGSGREEGRQEKEEGRAGGDPIPLLRVPLRLIGVVGKLYVLLESDRGLVLLDQHAAHERVLFEQMLRRLEQNNAPSQRLLLPETVELSVRDAQFLREQLPHLNRLGVGLSEFGERTFLLDALPPFVKSSNPRQFVIELIDGLKSAGQDVNGWRLGEDAVAKTVCRHAVKANDELSAPELENLIEDLRRCSMPYTCPHGRPTLIEMNYRELEKKFGRVT